VDIQRLARKLARKFKDVLFGTSQVNKKDY